MRLICSHSMQASDTELCCICFEQVCTIEVQDCGHQMCAQCTLALCCHNKPNPTTACLTPPVCPFCRSTIAHLVVVKIENQEDADRGIGDISSPKLRKARKSRNFSEGSSSFKGLSTSFSKMGGRGSGRIAAENEWIDKRWYLVALVIKDSIWSLRIPLCEFRRRDNKVKSLPSGAGPSG